MPYSSIQELSPAVRSKLPVHAQEIYKEAFNHAWEIYKTPKKRLPGISREATAHRIAWAAVKKKYKKNETTGQWEEV